MTPDLKVLIRPLLSLSLSMWRVLLVPILYCLLHTQDTTTHATVTQTISCVSKYWEAGLTDEAEDVSDGGDEDDKHVVEGQDGGGNQHVASPAELSTAEQQRCDGGADLG